MHGGFFYPSSSSFYSFSASFSFSFLTIFHMPKLMLIWIADCKNKYTHTHIYAFITKHKIWVTYWTLYTGNCAEIVTCLSHLVAIIIPCVLYFECSHLRNDEEGDLERFSHFPQSHTNQKGQHRAFVNQQILLCKFCVPGTVRIKRCSNWKICKTPCPSGA